MIRLVPLLLLSALAADPVCDKAKETPLPEKDMPDAAALKALAHCDSERLYYGFGGAANDEAARRCAFAERTPPREAPVFGGAAVLMMIYANGRGVPKNVPLATRFACEIDGAPAEVSSRLAHLERMKSGADQKPIDLCDDITSGYMAGHCAAHRERRKESGRSGDLQRLTGGWKASERKALAALDVAARRFFEARAANEVDLSGSARSAFQVEERKRLQQGFFDRLEQLEANELPIFSQKDLKDADAELNGVYERLRKKRDRRIGTITTEGIETTQREWLKYRDGWVTFGAKKYPSVGGDSWRTQLTRERTKQLRELEKAAGAS